MTSHQSTTAADRVSRPDRGFTLIELVIAIVLSGLIAGVVVAALITSLNAADSATAQVNDSTDTGLVSTFLVRDAQSSGGIEPSTAQPVAATLGVSKSDWGGCVQSAALVVRFSWLEHASASSHSTIVVTYAYNAGAQQLTRRTCTNGSAGTDIVLGRHITSAVATCKLGNQASDDGCNSRHPASVSLDLSGSGARAPLAVRLTASLRTTPSQLTVIGPGSLPIGQVGIAYPSTMVATSGAAIPANWSASGLPAGLTIAVNGTVSGTPMASGVFNVVGTITDAMGATAVKAYSLTVNPALSVVWAATLPNGKVGVTYSAPTGTASGGTTPYTWSATGLPPGLSVDTTGGVVGTPTAPGTFPVTIAVADVSGASAQKSYSLKVDPTDVCVAPTDWFGEYFKQDDLSGGVVYTQIDPVISFDWGAGSPSGIQANNFSIRWTKTTEFAAGTYTFRLDADEGSRLYIDGIRVIDNWNVSTIASYTKNLTGWHTIRVEYREKTGNAHVTLDTTVVAISPVSNNGVTAVPSIRQNQPYFGELNVTMNNPSDPVTEMSATIKVAQTAGITYKSSYQTVNKDNVAEGTQTGCGFIFYTFALKQGQTIARGSWVFAAQFDGSGTLHPTTGDTWTVTTMTSKGMTTVTGTFP